MIIFKLKINTAVVLRILFITLISLCAPNFTTNSLAEDCNCVKPGRSHIGRNRDGTCYFYRCLSGTGCTTPTRPPDVDVCDLQWTNELSQMTGVSFISPVHCPTGTPFNNSIRGTLEYDFYEWYNSLEL